MSINGIRPLSAILTATMLLPPLHAAPHVPPPDHNEITASIKPGEDFYGYANDVWLKATRLPDGVASIDTTAILRKQNAERVRYLIEYADRAASKNRAAASSNIRKIADYYASRLDMPGIEARGMAPLAHDLSAIAAIDGRTALSAYLGRTLRLDDGSDTQPDSLWALWIHQSFHDPFHYAAHVVQGGLGLPDKDDYLSPERAGRRSLYRAHIANMLRFAGFDQADMRADRVLTLEIAIARTHASRADTDDVFKTDNDWHRSDFDAKAPGVDWPAFFTAAGLHNDRFVIWQPRSVIEGARLVANQPVDSWKDYLAFHLIEHHAEVLPRAIGAERRAFEARIAGAVSPPASPPPVQTALAATEAVFGDAIGRLYVAHYFPPQAKAAAQAMVDNIRTAFRTRFASLDWMSPETKRKALAKLAGLRIGLGYPGTWTDYSRLSVIRDDAFGNFQRAEIDVYRRETAKLSRPVDPNEWSGQLHPQMAGAILNISPNSMQFAAGLLQPPYFDANGDTAANYGSAGAGIAHEITHSFDEIGNQYDASGRLTPWWNKDDLTHYRHATEGLVAQLDAYCFKADLCVHGKQVLGESAADLAGLMVAYEAYHLSLHGRRDAVKNGLSGDQRFFVSFAQRWRRLQTDDALRRQIDTDPHTPPPYRSDVVRNMDAWHRAFDIKSGMPLYLDPSDRVRIW